MTSIQSALIAVAADNAPDERAAKQRVYAARSSA